MLFWHVRCMCCGVLVGNRTAAARPMETTGLVAVRTRETVATGVALLLLPLLLPLLLGRVLVPLVVLLLVRVLVVLLLVRVLVVAVQVVVLCGLPQTRSWVNGAGCGSGRACRW